MVIIEEYLLILAILVIYKTLFPKLREVEEFVYVEKYTYIFEDISSEISQICSFRIRSI